MAVLKSSLMDGYVVRASLRGKTQYVGHFETKTAAIAAYEKASGTKYMNYRQTKAEKRRAYENEVRRRFAELSKKQK